MVDFSDLRHGPVLLESIKTGSMRSREEGLLFDKSLVLGFRICAELRVFMSYKQHKQALRVIAEALGVQVLYSVTRLPI